MVTSATNPTDGRDVYQDPAALEAGQNSNRLLLMLLVFGLAYVGWQYRGGLASLMRKDHDVSD